MSLTKWSFVVCSSRRRLKRHSVSRCPRDDLGWLRLSDDVPQTLWTERCRPDVPRGRRSSSGGPDLRRRNAHVDGLQGLSLVRRVSIFLFTRVRISRVLNEREGEFAYKNTSSNLSC